MVYCINPFVKAFDAERYISLFNFMNGKMLICYNSVEIDLVRQLLSGDIELEVGSQAVIQKLLDDDFVVGEFNDVYKLLEMQYDLFSCAAKELSITMMLSEMCNFRCKYCYETFDTHVIDDSRLQGVIHFVYDLVKEYRYSSVAISWFGGEPTLYKDRVIKFMHILRTELGDSVSVSGSMTTNAYLLEKTDFVDYYNAGIKNYQITVDGFAKTHNKLRVLRDGSPTWDTIIANLRDIYSLRFEDISILLRINYNEDVIHNIYSFIDFVKNEFANEFTIHLHPIFDSSNASEKMISLSDEMADTIEEQIGIYLSNNGVRTDFAELRAKLFGGVCYAALPNSFVIDPYGVIRKCTVNLKDDKNKVGQIIDGVNYSMNFYALADWTKTQITNSECVNCCIYPVCMKRGCIAGVVNGDNNCKVNKKAIFSYLQNLSKLAFSYQLNLDELGENDEQVVEME